MAFVDRIRLFGWADEDEQETTVLGFSSSAVSAGEQAAEELAEYLEKTERILRRIETPAQLAHLAELCYEIKPPLDDDQLRGVARIAVRYADSRKIAEVFDNRKEIPVRTTEAHPDTVILSTG